MRSLIEEIYPASAAAQKTGTRVETAGFAAEVVRADAAGVQEMVFHFRDAVSRPLVLDLHDGGARRLP
jgi:hypothetical protein